MAGTKPAARQAPASAEVTAYRLRLATVVLAALVLVLAVLSVPIGLAGRQPFDGLALVAVLAAVLGWLITRRQPGNRISLLLLGFGGLLVFYEDAARYAVADYHVHSGTLPLGFPAVLIASELWIAPLISRTLSYTLVTGLLVGVYAGVVLLATEVFRFRAPVAVAASTLAAAALFNPLRRRVQKIVDRRFNRARYDADKTVAAFAARLNDAVDLDSIRDDLAGVIHRALEPANLSVWINERG